MVPGITERERLVADMQRLEWLADATLGPARIGCAVAPSTKSTSPRPDLPIGIWRRGLSSARVFGRRIRLLQPEPAVALPERSPAPTR